jgi:hypothetical protein
MNRKRLILTALTLLAAAGTALAEPVGSAFTYQGKLAVNGNDASGSYDIQYKLFAAASGGNQVGNTFVAPATPVTGGLFNSTIDFGPYALNGDAMWLEIAVRPAGGGAYTTLTPRQRITPAPYAAGLALPYNATTSTQGTMMSLNQYGDGPTARFEVNKTTSGSTALSAYTFGDGLAGEFIISKSGNSSPAVRAVTNGMGKAGEFRTSNAGNNIPALTAESNNMGPALSTVNSSIGRAAFFRNSSTSYAGDAVKMENNGPGSVLGISSPQGQGAWIALPSTNSSKALNITHAGNGDGLVITKSNATNAGSALVVQAQTPTATAIDIKRGHVRRVYTNGGSPALATPIAFGRIAASYGHPRPGAGNIAAEYVSAASSATNHRLKVTVTGDPYPEDWTILVTHTFPTIPTHQYRITTTQPDDYGRFYIDVNCTTCSSTAFNLMEGDLNIVIYRP